MTRLAQISLSPGHAFVEHRQVLVAYPPVGLHHIQQSILGHEHLKGTGCPFQKKVDDLTSLNELTETRE